MESTRLRALAREQAGFARDAGAPSRRAGALHGGARGRGGKLFTALGGGAYRVGRSCHCVVVGGQGYEDFGTS